MQLTQQRNERMLEKILYIVIFFLCAIFLQWIMHKVRKNHNKGDTAIFVGNGAIMGIVNNDINFLYAVLGFVLGDEVGKIAGWH